jgi:long-chain acyl-CoA synthetase
MALYDFTIYDLIARNARSFGNKPAWFEADDRHTWTFAEVKEQVDRLAGGLQASGVSKGDRLGILGKNCFEYFLLYGAAAALGAIALPINWRLSADEICFNLNDCDPVALFVDQEYQDIVQGLQARLTSVKTYYNLTRNAGAFREFEALLHAEADFVPADVTTDDGFVIIHTAAVGGRPRGALLSHGNLLFADLQLNYFFHLGPEDVHLNILPLFHAGGLFIALASFMAGSLNVNMSRFDPTRAVELIEEQRASIMFEFSPILASLLEEYQKKGSDMSSLKAVAGLDTPATIEQYQEMTGGTFYCLYGQTETSCMVTFGRYSERPGSAGRTIPLAQLDLVDDEGRPVPTGQQGEIITRGPMVFKGYWNLPEESADTFRRDWHHTGDLGRFDEDGFLWYEGRKAEKELIKPGGENVYPAEVELVICQHPLIEAAVVFGVPDPKWKEGIKAVCQVRSGQEIEPRAIIEFVGERIASYKKPRYVEFVKELPALPDGSPDRVKIKSVYGGSQ